VTLFIAAFEGGEDALTEGIDHTLCCGHVHGIEYEFDAQMPSHRPADHAATSSIDDDGQIREIRPRRNVGDVGYPEAIRTNHTRARGTYTGTPMGGPARSHELESDQSLPADAAPDRPPGART